MIIFNPKLLPYPVGFTNNGSTCHFNSLIQMLLSCTSLSEVFIKNKDMYQKYPLIKKYIDIIETVTSNTNQQPIIDIHPLLSELIKVIGKSFDFANGQDCADMGYILAIDAMNVSKLFTHKYKHIIICTKCKHMIVKEREGTQFEIHEPLTIEQIQPYILQNVSKLDGYKCDGCGSVSTCIEQSTLIKVPEIILLVFNRFNKFVVPFPDKIQIPMMENKTNLYIPIAQIEHTGIVCGGHYVCKAIRRSKNENKGEAVLLNDSSISYTKLGANPYVYMVAYQLMSE